MIFLYSCVKSSRTSAWAFESLEDDPNLRFQLLSHFVVMVHSIMSKSTAKWTSMSLWGRLDVDRWWEHCAIDKLWRRGRDLPLLQPPKYHFADGPVNQLWRGRALLRSFFRSGHVSMGWYTPSCYAKLRGRPRVQPPTSSPAYHRRVPSLIEVAFLRDTFVTWLLILKGFCCLGSGRDRPGGWQG